MPKQGDDSSDSEKNFDLHNQDHELKPGTSQNVDEVFMDDDDEEEPPATIQERAARTASSVLENEVWMRKGSFDVNQLHQLRELYNTQNKQTEEEDEQALLDALKERNTDELKSLRQVSAVLENFETQPYVEEPVASQSAEQRQISRPRRFLAGAGRYANKLLKKSEDQLDDEEDEELMETEEKDSLTKALGGKTQVKKHKRISREVAKLRFSNPGSAFIDHFNLDDEGKASLELDYSQRSSRKAKVNASDRLRGTRTKPERQEFMSPQKHQIKPVICHNQNGELMVNGEVVADLCDCLQESCTGCFFRCPECGSNKCGPLCRRQRQQFAYCVAEQRQKTVQPAWVQNFHNKMEEKRPLIFLESGAEDQDDSEINTMDRNEDPTSGTTKIQMSIEGIRREHSTQGASTTKLAVLIWLALQNAVHTILIRYSRARDVPEMFFSSVAVFFTEVFKVVVCLYMVCGEARGLFGGVRLIKKQVYDQPWDTLKVCIPAMLYICQNNLFYVAASHLDAATFMIVSQLKIFATAIFSILLLDRKLARIQWISLAVLSAGVILVQLQQGSTKQKEDSRMNPFIGFTSACIACTISGFAGVFFERILKGTAPVSVWMRNVQMCVFSMPAALLGAFLQDGSQIQEKGFLYGFDWVVWFVAFWYGIGGLSVAVCIKYADNIAKNFATSVAIILATLGSVYIFNFQPTLMFVAGAALVIASIFLYSSSTVVTVRPRSSKA
ncbi:UDP-galactose transporter [Aphelenchoides bicaudatus]|nr:UDP-galactose transporter [Aphelenchoides bicaudatus]